MTALRGWAGRRGFVRRSGGPGWALVGDAGYFKDPISAHGLTDALRDAELLAEAILSAARGRGGARALAVYQRRRDELSLPLFGAVDALARYDWDQPTVRRLLQQAAAATKAETAAIEELGREPRAFDGLAVTT